jgi:hypothetical protein
MSKKVKCSKLELFMNTFPAMETVLFLFDDVFLSNPVEGFHVTNKTILEVKCTDCGTRVGGIIVRMISILNADGHVEFIQDKFSFNVAFKKMP